MQLYVNLMKPNSGERSKRSLVSQIKWWPIFFIYSLGKTAFYLIIIIQPAFHSVHHSLLRVLVMMIGELDFVTTFIDTIGEKCKGNKKLLNPFPLTGQFFLFLCLFFLTTALMNLLVRNWFDMYF